MRVTARWVTMQMFEKHFEWGYECFSLVCQGNKYWKLQRLQLPLTSHIYWQSTYSSVASAWARPSHRALSLSAHLPPSRPAICHTGRSALSLWTGSTPPPTTKSSDSAERPHGAFETCVHVQCTLSQCHPALTPSLSCPMVTLLRGLRRAAISTLKISVKPRSNFPPAKNTWKKVMEELEECWC